MKEFLKNVASTIIVLAILASILLTFIGWVATGFNVVFN